MPGNGRRDSAQKGLNEEETEDLVLDDEAWYELMIRAWNCATCGEEIQKTCMPDCAECGEEWERRSCT